MTRHDTATGDPTPAALESTTATELAPRRADSSRVEIFQMLGWRWDITAAKQITQGRVPEGRIATEWWAGMLNLIVIDPEHAAVVDLSQPLIVATVPTGGMLIIDGWHRLCKALTIGVEELSAVVLTAKEERACRICGGEEPAEEDLADIENLDEDAEENMVEGDEENLVGSA
ncbi:ParB N-terminal domain-containing protein [Nonomuraea angiospora]|uniref:ParB N-terminal domain-containing protein n=1 Tax=Nonomuraea angiospora TaxID=46172 RepID=UPI003411AF54